MKDDEIDKINSADKEALIFFRLLLSNCFSWKIYCDDHSSLSKKLLLSISIDRLIQSKSIKK